MTASESPASISGFVVRLAIFYSAYVALIGINLLVLPLWFSAKGLDAGEIGLVLAAPILVRIVAVPLITAFADRIDALRGTLIVVAIATALGYAGLSLASGFVALFAIMALLSIPNAPMMALADAYAVTGLARRKRAYGPVRLWGSVAFAAANLAAGWMLDVIAPVHLIWLVVGVAGITALSSVALQPLDISAQPAREGNAFTLLRQPSFVLVVFAASLIQASHAFYYGFSSIDWRGQGLGGFHIGALWGISVIAEIFLFAVAHRLPPLFGPAMLLVIGGAAAVIRWIFMALVPPDAALPVLQCLHGLSFCATHLGTIGFLARSAPPRLAATAQGINATIYGLTFAAMTGLSGWLYGAYGAAGYAAMAISAATGIVMLVFLPAVWKLPPAAKA